MFTDKRIINIQSILLALVGLGFTLQPIIRFIDRHLRHAHIAELNFLGIVPGLALIIIGFILLYLAPQLRKRRQVAYFLSLGLLVVAFILMLVQRHISAASELIIIITWSWLALSRQFYTVRSDLVSLASGIRTAALVAFGGYLYGVLGFLFLAGRGFHESLTLSQAVILSFRTIFTFQSVNTFSYQGEFFVHSLDAISALIAILVIISLFRPVKFALGARRDDKKRALAILEKDSMSSEDYFKLWPDDKHYFFSKSGQSFLAYKTTGRTAIILGDPSGKVGEYSQLVADFNRFVTLNGWNVAIIGSTSISRTIFQDEGLNELFIGNEAVIPISNFVNQTLRSKHFRYVYNRAKKEGLSVEHWETISDSQMVALKHISDKWLSHGGRKEYTFFMGYFDPSYIRAGGVMVLKREDEAIAYISILPSFLDNEMSIDHFRSIPGASSIGMHFLLAELITRLHALNKTSLNIGFAPLSGIELQDNQPILEGRLLALVKKFGNRYYSFKGIEQFKGKSDPIWHPRYLYYSGGRVAALATTVRDIERASRRGVERYKKTKLVIAVIGVIAVLALIQFL